MARPTTALPRTPAPTTGTSLAPSGFGEKMRVNATALVTKSDKTSLESSNWDFFQPHDEPGDERARPLRLRLERRPRDERARLQDGQGGRGHGHPGGQFKWANMDSTDEVA